MKSLKNILFLLFGLTLLTSCEDVIELELEDTTPRIIIDATLNMSTQEARVFFTNSNGFYEDTEPITVSGASAVLRNDIGISVTLSETEPGLYTAANIPVNPGEEWTLEIESEGLTYTAITTAPRPAVLDSLITELEDRPFGGGTEVRLFAEWQDEAEVQNFYRLRPFRNDTLLTQAYNLIDDEFSDGDIMSIPIMEEFDLGSLVKLELMSVDQNYYRYFLELSSVVSNGFNSSSPYNPIGNFNNEALGYFGIFSVSAKEVQL